jgi:type IV pilus assembly protein PilY1
MKKQFSKILMMLALSAAQWSAQADAIDLFAGVPNSTGASNLLFVIDNAANFSSNAAGSTCIIDGTQTELSGTVGGVEQCALHAAISALDLSKVSLQVGIMMYKTNGVVDYKGVACPGGQNAGGCLLYPLAALTPSTRPELLNWIKSWKTTGGSGVGYVKANNQATAAAMQEAWAYFAGKTGLSGRNYASIAPTAGCGRNTVVFVGNSYSSSGSPGDSIGNSGPRDALEGKNSTISMRASPPATDVQLITNTANNSTTSCGIVNFPAPGVHENKGFYTDEWARYMLGQSITTYTIGVLGPSCQAEYAWLLESTAKVGGGKYFPTKNVNELTAAFQSILSEVLAVNSAFASSSFPVSVATQGSFLNQVYTGMFRPDRDSLPRWVGNLKQYKLGFVGSSLELIDADNKAAVSSSGSNFIAECARSFWTPPITSPDSYWNNNTEANCVGYASVSNTPDGNLVEKGGQGYLLRNTSPANRTVTTCSQTLASCTSLTNFDSNNSAIAAASLGVSTTADRTALINWARGTNVKDSVGEPATVAATAMRPSAHGDVVHSRPLAINLGTATVPKTLVFYGGNDGILRAVNGNRPDLPSTNFNATVGTATVSVAPGEEFWSFMAPEFYSSIKRLYDNTNKISSPAIIGGTSKSYGMDGVVTGFRDASGGAWVYATMRRGGRAVYAFKVDGTTLAISLKWKLGCDSSGCSAGLDRIGQTWAEPKLINAGYSTSKPLLIMGGGYDAVCEDAANCTTPATGDRIYLIDADTGEVLKTFNTLRSVVGNVNFARDASGLVTYGYAADLGGNLYRIGSGDDAMAPIGITVPSAWTMKQIASLGCATLGSCTSPPNRKFMFGPDVVVEGDTHYLMVGSGDREKPLNTANTTPNYFFLIKDKPAVSGYLSGEVTNCSGSLTNPMMCLNSLLPVAVGATPSTSDLATKKGWYFTLKPNEQVVTAALTVFGTVYFSTHEPTVPSLTTCSNSLGTTRAYKVNYIDAKSPANALFTALQNVGLPPSPVAGKVILDDGKVVPFILGSKGPFGVEEIVTSPSSPKLSRIRSYWYIQK